MDANRHADGDTDADDEVHEAREHNNVAPFRSTPHPTATVSNALADLTARARASAIPTSL